LREKLASVIVPALKEVGKSSSMVDKENTSAGKLKMPNIWIECK
jgi:hypothetical protein